MIQNLRIALIKMFISSKQLFVWHLSRRIVRRESAGKEAAICMKKPTELDKIKLVPLTNGYPENVIKSFMA